MEKMLNNQVGPRFVEITRQILHDKGQCSSIFHIKLLPRHVVATHGRRGIPLKDVRVDSVDTFAAQCKARV